MHMHLHKCMYICVSSSMCSCGSAQLYMHMCVCTHMCVGTYIHYHRCLCTFTALYMHKWMNYCTCLLASKISGANFLFWILASAFSLKLFLSNISPWTCSHGILTSSLLVSRFEPQAFSLALLPFDFWMWVFDLYLLSMDFQLWASGLKVLASSI